MSQNTWGAGGGSTGLGWTAVSSPRIGPSHRWTLGGAVAAKVWGGGIFGKAVRTLRGRQRREAKEEEQWTREKEGEGGIERERVIESGCERVIESESVSRAIE